MSAPALRLFEPSTPADEATILRRLLEEARDRIVTLEAENARLRLRCRQPDPLRVLMGEQIHGLREKGMPWRLIAKRVHRTIRSAQRIYRDWRLQMR